MATTVSSQADSSVCHFFRLPPELRNDIYRLVVVRPERQPIAVDSSGHTRPPLLNTCKQIRTEALPIFYTENDLHFTIIDFNCSAITKLLNTVKDIARKEFPNAKWPFRVHIATRFNSPNWSNLLQWIRAAQQNPAFLVPAEPADLAKAQDRNLDRHIIAGMFHVAGKLKDKEWSVVKEILEGMRPSLVLFDERWQMD